MTVKDSVTHDDEGNLYSIDDVVARHWGVPETGRQRKLVDDLEALFAAKTNVNRVLGVEEVLRQIRKVQDFMSEFLVENRSANVDRGFSPVGPAAKEIGKALDSLLASYRSITSPDA